MHRFNIAHDLLEAALARGGGAAAELRRAFGRRRAVLACRAACTGAACWVAGRGGRGSRREDARVPHAGPLPGGDHGMRLRRPPAALLAEEAPLCQSTRTHALAHLSSKSDSGCREGRRRAA